ncbi:MAG: DUF104 domain-containing protein [Candidatus Coatesbacteria bacterium]|nr:DUF104 domain-containing protein [Candidatus Coatesbacteria bacterium]
MKAVKGVYENGEIRPCETVNIKGPVDVMVIVPDDVEAIARQREVKADALLKELDAIADSIEGEFDSAADIRQLRAERADAL